MLHFAKRVKYEQLSFMQAMQLLQELLSRDTEAEDAANKATSRLVKYFPS